MTTQLLGDILGRMNFTPDIWLEKQILLARHASEAYKFFDRDVESFEEYQRFQSSDNFRSCRYIVSFMGLPGKGPDATFAGIYRVVGRYKKGEVNFREPQGDSEVVSACQGQSFLYGLVRLREFDFLQCGWDIKWNLPGPAKYQYLKPSLDIEVLRLGTGILQDIGSMITQSLMGQAAYEVIEDSTAFSEGARFYARHIARERSAALVKWVKEKARQDGAYSCHICKFDFQKTYGIDYLECHHTIPVSTLTDGEKTKVEDVVLLCANCHRAVHKRKPWLRKHELHKLLRTGHTD